MFLSNSLFTDKKLCSCHMLFKQGRLLVCSHVFFHKSETYLKEIQHCLPVISKTNQVNYTCFELFQNLNMGIRNLSCTANVQRVFKGRLVFTYKPFSNFPGGDSNYSFLKTKIDYFSHLISESGSDNKSFFTGSPRNVSYYISYF